MTTRTLLHAPAAIVTLVIGLTAVAAIESLASIFTARAIVAREAPQKANAFPSPRVEPTAPERIAVRTEFSCYDPHLLPIWHELKKNQGFKSWLWDDYGPLNCSDLLMIKPVDLNKDGTDEFFVRGKDFKLCSAVGNCALWIFEVKKSRARMLLATTDYGGEDYSNFGKQAQRTRTRGYSNILVKGHFTAAETSFTTYSFDGKKYVQSRCMFEVPKESRDGEGTMELITCKEFDRRLGIK